MARAEVIGENADHLRFDCPGCDSAHVITIAPHPNPWEWNGDTDHPTIAPSVLVTGGEHNIRCHSFVRDGRIEFLTDCTHALAGGQLDLPELDTDGDTVIRSYD